MMASNNTILDEAFEIAPSVAVLGGIANVDNTEALYGVEIGFNCLATDTVRQQLQITNFKDNNFEVLQVNLNPHYLVDLSKDLNLGVGPTFGLAKVKNAGDSDTIFTYGLGMSLTASVSDNIFIATEVKYELTQDATLSGTSSSFDNAKAFVKAGYAF